MRSFDPKNDIEYTAITQLEQEILAFDPCEILGQYYEYPGQQ